MTHEEICTSLSPFFDKFILHHKELLVNKMVSPIASDDEVKALRVKYAYLDELLNNVRNNTNE